MNHLIPSRLRTPPGGLWDLSGLDDTGRESTRLALRPFFQSEREMLAIILISSNFEAPPSK